MRLVNNFDKTINFENLEDAKKYYTPTEEVDKDTRDKSNYLGNDFEAYIQRWEQYILDIKKAEDLEELCDILNHNSDEFDSGTRWAVID